jgi:hypothetical protein
MGEVLDDGEKEYSYLLAEQQLRRERSIEKWTPWLVVLYFAWIPLAIFLYYVLFPV